MTADLQRLAQQALIWLPQAALGLLIFLILWLVGAVVGGLIRRTGKKMEHGRALLLRLGGHVITITFIAIGATAGLGTMGVDVSALVAGLGLTGFAVGLALKDVLANLVAGLLLLFYRPFGKGDWVEVAGLRGEVADIDLRYTRLHGAEKTYLIPNSLLFTSTVTLAAHEAAPKDTNPTEVRK